MGKGTGASKSKSKAQDDRLRVKLQKLSDNREGLAQWKRKATEHQLACTI